MQAKATGGQATAPQGSAALPVGSGVSLGQNRAKFLPWQKFRPYLASGAGKLVLSTAKQRTTPLLHLITSYYILPTCISIAITIPPCACVHHLSRDKERPLVAMTRRYGGRIYP